MDLSGSWGGLPGAMLRIEVEPNLSRVPAVVVSLAFADLGRLGCEVLLAVWTMAVFILSSVFGFFSLDCLSQFSEVFDTGRLLDLRLGGSMGPLEAEGGLGGEEELDTKDTPWDEVRGGIKEGAAAWEEDAIWQAGTGTRQGCYGRIGSVGDTATAQSMMPWRWVSCSTTDGQE